jgi:predicted dehydrogenase
MDFSQSTTLNFGVAGLGWPGARHAEAVQLCTGARLHAACDVEEARRAQFAAQFPSTRIFSSLDEMLADPTLDAALICLPNFLHFPATMAALRAGKHVLCEKPPTLDAAEMGLIKAEIESRGLLYFFGRQSRFEGSVLAAKRLIDSGRLGTIYHGKAFFSRSRGIPIGVGGWFLDRARSGGGAVIDLGVHALDSIWYLMGCPRPASVSAQVFSHFSELLPAGVTSTVEDAGYAFVRFETGAVIFLDTSWAANLPDEFPAHPSYGRELRTCYVYGSRATLRLSPLTLFENQGGKLVDTTIQADPDEFFRLQMQNFIDAIANRAAPINNAAQALDLMRMLDAIYVSSRTGREVLL